MNPLIHRPAFALAGLAFSLLVFAATAQQYGIMPYSDDLLQHWQADRVALPVYQAPGGYPAYRGSVNLLEHLNYRAVDRDQGHTGTCWVWGCQAVMSIDYAVKHPDAPLLTNGFSVQFLVSHLDMVDPAQMGGGTPVMFARFYEAMAFNIPWDNTNAAWTDRNNWNKTPASTIYTKPNVPVESVVVSDVATFGIPDALAIANLKSALDGGHALWFNLTLANEEDWDIFCTFWGKTNATEATVINLDYGDGHSLGMTGGSHLMACVGYDDTDPDPTQHCWLVLNSWGRGDNPDDTRRPNGLFRMAMHTKYSAALKCGMVDDAPMFEWGLLDTTFATKVRKGFGTLAVNLQTRNPAASSIRIDRVSFPPASAPTNVFLAHVELNGRYFQCWPANGDWIRDTNGFHYLSHPGSAPALRLDIDSVNCPWSFAATNVNAEDNRYIDPHRSLYFAAFYKQDSPGGDSLPLGKLRAVTFDELASTQDGEYASQAPDSPTLALRLNGTQGVLRIAGETGSTCQVQESDALGREWTVRALVPMTQPVEEVAVPAPVTTNHYWRVKVQ
ncbi:MAG: hypothetical protein WCS42_08945 [Verrucomicrobiota bacterium]